MKRCNHFGILTLLLLIGLIFTFNVYMKNIHVQPTNGTNNPAVYINQWQQSNNDSNIMITTPSSNNSNITVTTPSSNITVTTPETVEVPFSIAIAKKFLYVLPRAAFFDKRIRGKHKNTTVILTHLKKSKIKIIACKVNGYSTTDFEIKMLNINYWLHTAHPECTHDEVLIFCYDTPAVNNSGVSVVYVNPENQSENIDIESEHSLIIPETTSASTVMTCTTVFDTPPHFGAWIRYQKTLGVDMININAQESFLNSSSFTDPFFIESLHSGFIQLTVWKEYLPPGASFYHSQALYYQNCLYRYLGVHEYCICADTDDFLTPTNGIDLDVHKLLYKVFHPSNKVGSSNLYWLRYVEPTNGFDPPESKIEDGNLTRYVDTSSPEQAGHLTKAMYKLSAMIELSIHQSLEYIDKSFFYRSVTPKDIAYMAHIKKTHIGS